MFVAGKPSHGYGGHEHNGGCLLLARCLDEGFPNVDTVAHKGWPEDPAALEGADRLVVFSNGGAGQPIIPYPARRLLAGGGEPLLE